MGPQKRNSRVQARATLQLDPSDVPGGDAGTISGPEIRTALSHGAREWPEWLTSATVDSPFVHSTSADDGWGLRESTEQCLGVRPKGGEGKSENIVPSRVILRRNWSPEEVAEGWRGKRRMRSVVWAARAGMGNSIRGLAHTFLFALLSARQLLLSTAGPWGTSIQALFEEFNGNLDRIEGVWVPRVPKYDYKKPDLLDPRPVVQGMPNLNREDWWYTNESTRNCAMAAMQCSSVWCIKSKIVQLMLGQPKNQLGEAIQSSLVLSPMLSHQELHHRHHHSIRVVKDFLGWALPGGTGRIRLAQSSPLIGGAELQEGGTHPALTLKFDVAVHIRTVHTCVEKGSEGREGCKSSSAADSYQSLKHWPELHKFLQVHNWACMSHLLAFLSTLKGSHTKDSQSGEHFSLAQVPQYEEHLLKFLEASSGSAGVRPRATESLASDLWTLEDAKAVAVEAAQGVPAEQNQQGLSILLATDSEALRPLFVEFLRPFGTVAFSSAGVVHLSFSKGEARVQSKTATLSEFYLLSRSANIVAFDSRNSTYAETGAMYGNGTLIRGVGKQTCDFKAEHVGIPIDKEV